MGVHKKQTQCERLLKHLQEKERITSFESYDLYGITQLASRIFELKKRGYKIKTTKRQEKTRYRERVNFVEYSLIQDL